MKNNRNKKVENRRMPFVSAEVQGTAKRFKPGTFTKVMSIYLLVVSALLLTIMLFQKNGYHLINGAITYYLLTGAVAGVLVWMVAGARKLVRRSALKKSMTISTVIIAVLIMVYTANFAIGRINYINTDFGRSKSPEATNELAIMRSYYIDIERMTEDIKTKHPEFTQDEIDTELVSRLQDNTGLGPDVFSYVYVAYPVRAGIFYYTKVEVGPELLIVAQDSDAELRVRWADENNATLYVNDPGPYDRGEFSVKCN